MAAGRWTPAGRGGAFWANPGTGLIGPKFLLSPPPLLIARQDTGNFYRLVPRPFLAHSVKISEIEGPKNSHPLPPNKCLETPIERLRYFPAGG